MIRCWTDDAWADYAWLAANDRRLLLRVNKLVDDICRHPFEGLGKPEPLKGNLAGLWSRRIDQKNRLVYLVEDDRVTFLSAKDHY